MKRLLFITERFPPDLGGLATSAYRIAQALEKLDVQVTILIFTRSLLPGTVQFSGGSIPVYRLGRYRQWDMTLPYALNLIEDLHQTQPFDGVWGHYLFPAGFLAVWFGQLHQIPSTVSARGNDLDRELFPPGDFARLHWTLTQAQIVTAVSQDLAHKIKTLVGREVIVLKNAVDPELFSPDHDAIDRLSLGIRPEEMVLGFSGELREKKGQRYLFQALSQVHAYRPVCLLIIGEVRQTQEAHLEVYRLHDPEAAQRVIVTGHLSDPQQVVRHLLACDLFLLPSLWEGMPNALLEAMASGLCCLASDAGGIPEVITSGIEGFILPKARLEELGNAIIDLLERDPTERQVIGAQARQRIKAEFSPTAEQQRLKRFLAQLWPEP